MRGGFASVAGGLRSAGGVIGGRWLLIPPGVRWRVGAGLALAALAALVWFVLVPVAPCGFPGGDECPPGDDAVALVPDEAYGYVHANLEYDNEAYEGARTLGERLPLLGQQLTSTVLGLDGEPIAYEQDVRPWSGGEVAVALMPGPRAALEPVLMLEADDRDAALAFAASRARGAVEERDVDGVTLRVDEDGRAVVVVEGFLLSGPEEAVRAFVAADAEGTETLEDTPAFVAAREALPDERFADAWLAPEAAQALFGGEGGLAAFRTFAGPDVTEGVAISAGGDGEGAEIAVRSILDPERPASAPAPFAQLPAYEPELTGELGPETLGFVGIGEPASSLDALLAQARASAPGLARGFERLVENLRRSGGVDLEGDLFAAIGGELAAAIEPAGGDGERAAATPYLTLVATDVDTEAALRAIARLQAPISDAADPVGGEAPAFRTIDLDGVEAQSLRISPVVELTYAATDGRLIVSTRPVGVRRALAGEGGLAETEAYERTTERIGEDPVSLLGYLQLRGLIELGEQIGLGEDPLYAAVAGDLRALEAAALAVRLEDSLLSTDLDLTLGATEPAPGAQPELDPAGPEELELPDLPEGPEEGATVPDAG
jgi:hypothetical protein